MYTIPMTTLEAFSTVDFRAPPPSPVASGRRRSSSTNDDILTEYVHQSLSVPNLILPDRVFPRQKSTENPPILDLNKSDELEDKSARKFLEVGCLEVINHGISLEFIKLVLDLGGDIFEISPEKKRTVRRSAVRLYGFDEIHEEEEIISSRRDESEEFVWCGEEAMRLEKEGIWPPTVYSNFSEKMEKLSGIIEEIAEKILKFIQCTNIRKFDLNNNGVMEREVAGKLCYIHKHCLETDRQLEDSLRYDVIRMLIRGSEYPHALCLHICNGSSEFHVYSKRGWVSFCRFSQNSILVTVGDLLQAWTGGQHKHVIGRPVYRSGDEKNIISMAFLYSLPKSTNTSIKEETFMTISLTQQIKIAVLSILVYQFSFYVYNILYKIFAN